MKKTLRGKRHIRARRSVEFGRDKRRRRRLYWGPRNISQVVEGLPGRIKVAMKEIEQSVQAAGCAAAAYYQNTERN